MGLLDWLTQQFGEDRAPRHPASHMHATYWGAGVPQLHPVKDISLTGAYLLDPVQWPVGTLLDGVLRKDAQTTDQAHDLVHVSFKVVRHGPDGMGVQFILPTKKERSDLRQFLD